MHFWEIASYLGVRAGGVHDRWGQRERTRQSRTLVALLLLIVTLSLGAGVLLADPSPAKAAGFPDVANSHPAYEAINFLSTAGIISGYQDGRFGPGDTLKRGQATKMLVLWKAVPLVSGGSTFPDVDDTYRAYVETACAQGWITGFPNGRFKPYSTLSRQQMAIIMVRVMGWEDEAKALPVSEVDDVLSQFADAEEIAEVARPYVATAVAKGLFGGSNGCFLPKEGITRAQFCLVVYRAELSLGVSIKDVASDNSFYNKTRITISLSRAPDSVTARISSGGLLTIEYTGGVLSGEASYTFTSAEAKSLKAAQISFQPRVVSLTLQLGRYQSFRVMSLTPSEGSGHQIVVDVYKRSTGPDRDGPPLICVDPGHGGTASGAIGVSGTPEKSVNLSIALKLAEQLRAAGLDVMMTRETDVDVDLHDRATLANEAKASLFVSVHNNASTDSSTEGTETFYWGDTSMFSYEGKRLAEAIQRNLVAAVGSVDRGARTHWFNLVVLAETVMPAALVEVGFMSNSAEEAKLLTPEYQEAAARGIAQGIMEYLGWSTTVYTTEASDSAEPDAPF